MIFRLDEVGICLADVAVEPYVRNAVQSRADMHVSNALVLDVLRAVLIRMPVEQRPDITFLIYGKRVTFNRHMRSEDAWTDPRMSIGMDASTTILNAALAGR
jgi:hypothetical protein